MSGRWTAAGARPDPRDVPALERDAVASPPLPRDEYDPGAEAGNPSRRRPFHEIGWLLKVDPFGPCPCRSGRAAGECHDRWPGQLEKAAAEQARRAAA